MMLKKINVKLVLLGLLSFLVSAAISYLLTKNSVMTVDEPSRILAGFLAGAVVGSIMVVGPIEAALVAEAGFLAGAVVGSIMAVEPVIEAALGAGAVAAGVAVVIVGRGEVIEFLKNRKNIPAEKHTRRKTYTDKKIAIAAIFASEKQRANYPIILLYLIAIGLFLKYHYDLYALLSAIILVLVISQQQLLTYRIRKGYFGTNYHEARELIEFIIANSEKIDFSDGDGGTKRLLPESTTATQTVTAPTGGMKVP